MTTTEALAARLIAVEERVAAAERTAQRALDSTAVANVFARYQYLHNAFRDEEIIPLWVAQGTPGISAQYSNTGVYTDWDNVMAYHRGRPAPVGKLINHQLTTPVIEVSEDGETARGLWFLVGTESGLIEPEVADQLPPRWLSPGTVNGKHVWAHWVWAKYDITFLRQDGEWRIWKFRCVEVARTTFEENWIAFSRPTTRASNATSRTSEREAEWSTCLRWTSPPRTCPGPTTRTGQLDLVPGAAHSRRHPRSVNFERDGYR